MKEGTERGQKGNNNKVFDQRNKQGVFSVTGSLCMLHALTDQTQTVLQTPTNTAAIFMRFLSHFLADNLRCKYRVFFFDIMLVVHLYGFWSVEYIA
jgi:hypothetical protein